MGSGTALVQEEEVQIVSVDWTVEVRDRGRGRFVVVIVPFTYVGQCTREISIYSGGDILLGFFQ